ncbi:MAG: methionine gamma-lyase family protein, partial [Clostridia bacterium]
MEEKLINNYIEQCIDELKTIYNKIESTAYINQSKVLRAFQKECVALRHFSGTTGYGYDDTGRDTLYKVYADVFHTESALVSPLIASGTHAISLCLFGLSRPRELILSITGEPYDTLSDVIKGNDIGSLADYDIRFESIPLNRKGLIDLDAVQRTLNKVKPKIVYMQRSRGYEWRNAVSIDDFEEAITLVKTLSPDSIVLVDNCYGEFVDSREPSDVGADICVGSLIKNIGGGLAPTGGYVVGKAKLVDLIARRLTAPSVGAEIGSYAYGYQYYFEGLFLAPHIVSQALKTALLFSHSLSKLGYKTLPNINDKLSDIVCSITLNDKSKLIKFVQAIQKVSPIDSNVVPFPWDMPGYEDKVIMAAGCFVLGSSIEL